MAEETKSYSAVELAAIAARGEDKTDWEAIDALTDDDIRAAMASDPDWANVPEDWFKGAEAVFGTRIGTKAVSLRVPRDVLHFYKSTGPGWQSRMIDVLRSAMPKQSR